MLTKTRVQMIATLAVGGLLGYAAASGSLDRFRRASAEPPQPSGPVKPGGAAAVAAPCCSEGAARGQLVALADPKLKEAAAKA